MPFNIIKDSYKYCTENIPFFVFVLILMFGSSFIINLVDSVIVGPVIVSILMMGYGLQVTRDIIHGGNRLPKIMPKDIFLFGIKGYVLFFFYATIQSILLTIISSRLNFPDVEIKDLVLNFSNTLHMLRTHDPVSFTIFIVSLIIVVYVTTFFMELSLARLADGGRLRDSFHFRRIKHAIDIIGWRKYTWDYTKIITSIIVLTYLVNYNIPSDLVATVVDSILSFLIFVIEFIGIGNIYKIYIDSKSDENQIN